MVISPPGEGNGTLLQYSRLENPMDGGARWAAVHGVAKGLTRLSDLTFTFHFHALEKEMATHSSVLAWRVPGTGEPGGLPSVGSQSWTRLKRLSSSSSSSKLLPWWLRRLPAVRETQVRSLGQEDPLEKALATHSSTLAWRIPWMEEPGRL